MVVPPAPLLCRSVPEFTTSWRGQAWASVGQCQAGLTHARTVDHAWITLPVARDHQQHAITWCWGLRPAPRVGNASDGRSRIDHTGRWPDAHRSAALDASMRPASERGPRRRINLAEMSALDHATQIVRVGRLLVHEKLFGLVAQVTNSQLLLHLEVDRDRSQECSLHGAEHGTPRLYPAHPGRAHRRLPGLLGHRRRRRNRWLPLSPGVRVRHHGRLTRQPTQRGRKPLGSDGRRRRSRWQHRLPAPRRAPPPG
jgi:hypothetical protein